MLKIDLRFDKGIPQYVCSLCTSCTSAFGKSLCSVKNRGCCWYFPKFTLHEIHKMSKSQEGLDVLKKVMSVPNKKVYHYYIHAIGYFDEADYKKYIKSEQSQKDDVRDKTMFFRACPFVKEGTGCTIPSKYRSYICNFFICDEVTRAVKNCNIYKEYIKERSSYVRWIKWENYSNEMLLQNYGINLMNNFDDVIQVFEDVPLELYEFEKLPEIKADI